MFTVAITIFARKYIGGGEWGSTNFHTRAHEMVPSATTSDVPVDLFVFYRIFPLSSFRSGLRERVDRFVMWRIDDAANPHYQYRQSANKFGGAQFPTVGQGINGTKTKKKKRE